MKKIFSIIMVIILLVLSACALQQEKKQSANADPLNTVNTSQLTESTTKETTSSTNNTQATTKKEEKLIAITFDDGPCANTGKILDLFKKHNAKATFFIMGNRVATSPNTLNRIVNEGHEIGNHTWKHKNLSKLKKEDITKQITKTNKAVKELCGYDITLLRPPYGAINKKVKTIAKKNNMALIGWNIDTLDWDSKNKNKIYRVIKRTAKNGNIILCHDLYDATVEAMEKALPHLIKKGYKLVTVSELLKANGNEIQSGTLYYSQNEYYE